MRHGDGAKAGGTKRRLGILPGGTTSCRVTDVPYGDITRQCAQMLIVEGLGNKAQIFVDEDCLAARDCNTGSFLAAVLQRIEAVVSHLGHRLAGKKDSENAAFVLRFFVGEEFSC